MSAEEEAVAADEVCASCGVAAIDDVKLKKCACNLGLISGSADSISRSRFNFDFSTQKRDFKNLRLISRSAATATRE